MQSLLQTKIWADFKSRHGWCTHEVGSVFVLERALPLGQRMLYAPEVSLTGIEEKGLKDLAGQVKQLSQSAFFFRLELFNQSGMVEPGDQSAVAELTKAGYVKSFEEVQPEHRQWVDISGDETTIMASMKEKGRYNVRLAQRKGVTTRISNDTKDIEVFYNLFRETAIRDGFTIRTQAYFHDLCSTLFDNNLGELVIAEFEGQPLVALIVTYYDGLTSYLYGASSSVQRNLMAPYAAHWAAIQSAKKHGCTTYDLLQVAPAEASENHKYSNLTRFKQQFGGSQVTLLGGWDYVYSPVVYEVFKAAEKVRRK